MRHPWEFLRTGRKWIFLFGLTVLLPSLFLGLLSIRAFKGETIRQQYQRKERQQQIVRFLESDLNNWLFSLQTNSRRPSEHLFDFQIEGNDILFPALNVLISSSRSSRPGVSLSAEELRQWQQARITKMENSLSVTRAKARLSYQRIVQTQPRLAPLARLALLRLSLQGREYKEAAAWLNAIREKDADALTESGIPIWVACGLLLISSDLGCQSNDGAPSPSAEFLCSILARLVSGRWKLEATQWVVYASELSSGLRACQPKIGISQTHLFAATIAQAQQIHGRLHYLIEIYPQFLATRDQVNMANSVGGPVGKKYLPALKALLVLFPGKDRSSGYLLDAGRLKDQAERRLAELTVADDFTGVIHNLNTKEEAQYIASIRIASFPSFEIVFNERTDRGSFFNLQKHFFVYSTIVLLLVTLLGLAFTYRAVSHEMEVSRLKADFVAAVSHEFRSPLTSILALLERLESGKINDSATLKRYHRVIHQEVHRLSLLVNGLLDFARLEQGKKEFDLEPSNLVDLAKGTVKSFHDLGHADRLTFVEAEMSEPLVVSADRTAVAQCIQNLIDNAIKYSPKNSPVTVVTGRENGEVFLEVCDRGSGIPVSEQQKIFEHFYRARSTDIHNVKGAGIGLALVKRIMEGHGGRVTVDSRPDEGSKFRLVFPG